MRALTFFLCTALSACTRSEASPARPASATALPLPPPASAAPSAPKPSAPARYAFDRTHSPIDAGVAEALRAIAARGPALSADVFAKVGDSVTYSDDFVRCFASRERTRVPPSLSPVVERFRAGNAAGTDPFRRESESARIGWSAWQALSGSPSPLARELAAIAPRFALVQYGTNDIEIGQLHHFADRLFDIVDFLVERGTIPILFTIMPRRDRAAAAVWVPRYNAVIRGIAQARQVPLVDYHRELVRLPGDGLGKDGIHPTTFHGAQGRNACDLGPEGLAHGYNLRNLLALQALDRASRALGGAALDPASPALDGDGSAARPYRVRGLPFADAPRFGRKGRLDGYAGCGRALPAAGPEVVYRIEVERPTALRALGFDRRGEVDLYLLAGAAEPGACRASGRRLLEVRLQPGSHYLVLEAPGAGAETLLIVEGA